MPIAISVALGALGRYGVDCCSSGTPDPAGTRRPASANALGSVAAGIGGIYVGLLVVGR